MEHDGLIRSLDARRAGREIAEKRGSDARPKREPGYGRLQQLLRDDILEGRIPAGSRLKVNEIAARYGSSTNPAREALQGLEGEGLVKIEPNRGARVRSVDEDFVQNIFDIRGLIEPYIMRSFAEFATPDDVQAIRAIQARCQAGVDAGTYPEFHVHNVQFHAYIIDHHFNDVAIKIMKQHNGWVQALSRKHPLSLAHMRRSSAEHWLLIEAVEKGDPDEAARLIEIHMRNSREVLLSNLRRARLRGEPDSAAS
jgi:DNA-binding GntR family transcriptional regulator